VQEEMQKACFMNARATRNQIVEAADQLFYEQGFEHTSFSDIAETVQISRGNFYYHFKSKDEILDAVIGCRLANTRSMLEKWEADSARPGDRIQSFIRILIMNQTKIMLYGCPVGTLCAELGKLDHPSQANAEQLFDTFLDWLSRQFTLLGHDQEAETLALHILARSQGVAMLANVYRDEAFIEREVRDMCSWLESLAGSEGLHDEENQRDVHRPS
tara:strand:+ start:1235 stop:1882 length:648 start_codon:yes stop_codon:yes gene_type:complete